MNVALRRPRPPGLGDPASSASAGDAVLLGLGIQAGVGAVADDVVPEDEWRTRERADGGAAEHLVDGRIAPRTFGIRGRTDAEGGA